MNKNKLKVECDFDGVLYSISENIIKEASKKFNVEMTENDIVTYNFDTFSCEIRKYIYSKFADPYMMTNEDFLYEDALEFLKWINTEEEFDMKVRTLVRDVIVLKERQAFFKRLFKKHELNNIKYEVVNDKQEVPCDILIEDNPEAILKKKEGLVIVRRQPYNSFITTSKNIFVANNLNEVKGLMEKKLILRK